MFGIGDILGGVGSLIGLNQVDDPNTQFNPWNTSNFLGSANFDQGQINMELSPQQQQIAQMLGNQSQGLFSQFGGIPGGLGQLGQTAMQGGQGFFDSLLSFDPYEAANQQFGRMEQILEPYRTQDRENMTGALLSQGRLGSTGGARDREAYENTVANQRLQNLTKSFNEAQGVQRNLAGLGQSMGQFGMGVDQYGFNKAGQTQNQLYNQQNQLQQLAQMGLFAGQQQLGADQFNAGYAYNTDLMKGDALGGFFGGIGDAISMGGLF